MTYIRQISLNLIERFLLEHWLRGYKAFLLAVMFFWAADLAFYALHLRSAFFIALVVESAAIGALTVLNLVQATVEERLIGRRPRLNKHVPLRLREIIEKGEEPLPERISFVRAVVGFVRLDSETGKLRRDLYDMASSCAVEHGFVVLKETTEGIAFLANYFENSNWPLNLISFYENLMIRIERLPGTHAKVGASMGPLTIHPRNSAFTAEGHEIELATELCQRGAESQLVMTSKVWHSLSDALEGWSAHAHLHPVPGYQQAIPAMHVDRRLEADYCRHCWSCGQDVKVTQTAEGFIRVTCIEAHIQPNLKIVPVKTDDTGKLEIGAVKQMQVQAQAQVQSQSEIQDESDLDRRAG